MGKHDSYFPNEMLSAYLDGELSDEERLSVEKAVASSLSLKKDLQDIQRVKEKLAGLPDFKLEDGFGDQVYDRLNRSDDDAVVRRSLANDQRMATSRIIWGAAALVIAALLVSVRLSVLVSPPNNEKRLAERSLDLVPTEKDWLENPGVDESKDSLNLNSTESDAVLDVGPGLRPIHEGENNYRFSGGQYLAELAASVRSNSYRFVAVIHPEPASIDIYRELSYFFSRGAEKLFAPQSDSLGIRYLDVYTTVAQLKKFIEKNEAKFELCITEGADVLQTTSQPNVRYHFWRRNAVDEMPSHEGEPSDNDLFIDLENTGSRSHLDNALPVRFPALAEYELSGIDLSEFESAGKNEPIRVLFSIVPQLFLPTNSEVE